MKLNLRFLIAAFFVMMFYTAAVQAQANLTFEGGNGTPLSITLHQSVVYTINSTVCSSTSSLIFAFDEAGNPFSNTGGREVTGTISFSVNGGNPQQFAFINSGYPLPADLTPNDLYIFNYPLGNQLSPGDIVVLNPGTLTTTTSDIPGAKPANSSYPTFITNGSGARCSNNGVAAGTTAASVSVSGRVLINDRRGLSNALIYLTDSEGNTRRARTTSLGYYRFEDVQAGQSVTITVVSKRYQFAPQVLNLNEEISGLNFLAQQ